ncbi:hypothetical protein GOBAR_DD26976 [Gossypium barbadense]|nr:hypothetical protein GOBAR_DD26976 [Gossypium barbadense]
MADSRSQTVSQSQASSAGDQPRKRLWRPFITVLFTMFPVVAAMLVYQLDSFDPAPLPIHELGEAPVVVSLRNERMLQGAELLGAGELQGPEDIAYDSTANVVFTGCHDGWIKRVRPLGLALGHNKEIIVADAYKGLLNISKDGEVELLTDEADGHKFKLTDGVDIADNGMIYFTDASYKYNLNEDIWDILEGKPHGRFMSFDLVTRKTDVLVSHLYFANGVAVRRCRKYYTKGSKQGDLEKFIDDLPGFPDNIKYDGDGHYWIALPSANSVPLDIAFRYPFIRKVMAIVMKYIGRLPTEKDAGVLVVDLEGKPVAHYHDHRLSMITSGMKIGNRLYCGSVRHPHILKLDLAKENLWLSSTITMQ